jgi:hypothetical protein
LALRGHAWLGEQESEADEIGADNEKSTENISAFFVWLLDLGSNQGPTD